MKELLPPATRRLWSRIESDPLLGGFYLIGGTALSLSIQHRRSEDLDLAWPGLKLPNERVKALRNALQSEGWKLERNDSQESYEEFLIAGMELHDYQQDFIASVGGDSVRLSFFTASGLLDRLLQPSGSEKIVVPKLEFLFQSKALVTSSRSTSRDWLDLYMLIRDHGFTIEDYASCYLSLGASLELDIGLDRILSGKIGVSDPGYESLGDGLPTLDEVKEGLKTAIQSWRVSTAEDRFRRQKD